MENIDEKVAKNLGISNSLIRQEGNRDSVARTRGCDASYFDEPNFLLLQTK